MDLGIDGVSLRPPCSADAPALVEAIHESMPELSPWMPWATSTYDTAMANQWIVGGFDPHPFVLVESSGRVVGSCGLNQVDGLNRSANLGYWVRTGETGRGIATAATEALARHGLDDLDLDRIEVRMSTRNHGSRRVAEKSGARFEGTLRSALLLYGERHDAHVFSFVSGDL